MASLNPSPCKICAYPLPLVHPHRPAVCQRRHRVQLRSSTSVRPNSGPPRTPSSPVDSRATTPVPGQTLLRDRSLPASFNSRASSAPSAQLSSHWTLPSLSIPSCVCARSLLKTRRRLASMPLMVVSNLHITLRRLGISLLQIRTRATKTCSSAQHPSRFPLHT